MISQTMLIARKFNVCIAANIPNGYFKHMNDESGIASSWLYFFTGDGYIETDEGIVENFQTKGLYDISQYKGKVLHCHANNDGYFHAAFNFKPLTREVNAELLNSPVNRTVVGTSVFQAIFCLEGKITCNNIEVDTWKFAEIPNGKQVEIIVPDGAVAVLFKEK